MCVITHRRESVAIDCLGDIINQKVANIKHEGVYMFGGLFGVQSADRKISDKLFYLALGCDVKHKWKELETKGQIP